MDVDITTYACVLSSSVGFGYFYDQIKDKERKKWVGTAAGILLLLITNTNYLWHVALVFAVNAGIILFISKRYCHIISFFFSFAYLLFFRISTTNFGTFYLPPYNNFTQMMLTLKLVGLAFEVNSCHLQQKNTDQDPKSKNIKDYLKINFWDIFHYSFNYIGMASGPYYKYQTFVDFFELPHSKNAPKITETIRSIKNILFHFTLYYCASYYWHYSYALSEEFYNDHSWLYRVWYSWPIFFIFRMQIYAGVFTAQAVCTMVGFGAYPSITQPKPGHGPTKNVDEIENSDLELKYYQYDFETINNMRPYEADFCTTFREAMKNWNMCIQYWLVQNVYKRFPFKPFRTIATMLVSSYWHGFFIGYYVCIFSAAFYLPVEDVYVKLLIRNDNSKNQLFWKWIIWFFKMQAFSYLSVAFHLLTFNEVLRYYRSTYYCGFIGSVILYIIGVCLLKISKQKSKKLEQNGSVSNGNLK